MAKRKLEKRQKVLIVLLLIPVLLFTALVVAAGFSGVLSWNHYGLVFKEVNGGYCVDCIDGLYELFATSIDIPDTYKGKPVVAIDEGAFDFAENIKSITIPDSVTSIGEDAFYGCSSLTSITIGNGVTSIGDGAFYDCTSLTYNEYGNAYYLGNEKNPYLVLVEAKSEYITSCIIHEATRFIHSSAFSGCNCLTKIAIPDNVTSIGSSAFWGCAGLTSINIPASVTSIGSNAFQHCEWTSIIIDRNNKSYWMSDGVLFDYDGKFLHSYLKYDSASDVPEYTIPDSVTSIGDGAFCYCNMTSIIIPDGVTSIGDGAFESCSNLTSIIIPDGVTSIGDYTFIHCYSLTSIIIPDGVTSIGRSAFQECWITSITIPDSITSIGDLAFFGNRNLTSITFEGTKAQWKQISKGYNWNSYTGEYTVYCTDGEISKK